MRDWFGPTSIRQTIIDVANSTKSNRKIEIIRFSPTFFFSFCLNWEKKLENAVQNLHDFHIGTILHLQITFCFFYCFCFLLGSIVSVWLFIHCNRKIVGIHSFIFCFSLSISLQIRRHYGLMNNVTLIWLALTKPASVSVNAAFQSATIQNRFASFVQRISIYSCEIMR